MATRSSPFDLWDIIRKIERRLHALETGRGASPDAAWRIPALLNSWVNFDAVGTASQQARYRKLSNGQVEIQGQVKSGTVSSTTTGTIFTLPVGYRPGPGALSFAVNAADALARLDVMPDGSVRAMTGSNAYFPINVTFTPV